MLIKFCSENPKRRYLMEKLPVDGDIILKWILNMDSEYGQDLFGSLQGPMADSNEQHAQIFGLKKGGKILDHPRNC